MTAKKKILRICGIICGISGLIILATSIYPILSYEWTASQKFPTLISPIPDSEGSFSFQNLGSNLNSNKASNWFVGAPNKDGFQSKDIQFYTISVPKLGIQDASVAVGTEDLSKNLIQYPGTASPGKIGNTVIFGHSVLPQFFNPKNYMSIFSTLPELNKGDFIYANYDGIAYQFKVQDMFEVWPNDIQILDQNNDDSYITLVTCVPPGNPLNPKRLIVRAKLVPAKEANANIGN